MKRVTDVIRKCKKNFKSFFKSESQSFIKWFSYFFQGTRKNIEIILVVISIFLSVIGLYIGYKSLFVAIPQYQEFIEKSSIQDINGNWNIKFITEDADMQEYIGMYADYDVFLIGAKDEYRGKGEKYNDNGKMIKPENRAKIEFEMIIKDNNMYGFYDLYGSRLVSGNMEVTLNENGDQFEGSFIISAANSRGKVIGKKKE